MWKNNTHTFFPAFINDITEFAILNGDGNVVKTFSDEEHINMLKGVVSAGAYKKQYQNEYDGFSMITIVSDGKEYELDIVTNDLIIFNGLYSVENGKFNELLALIHES